MKISVYKGRILSSFYEDTLLLMRLVLTILIMRPATELTVEATSLTLVKYCKIAFAGKVMAFVCWLVTVCACLLCGVNQEASSSCQWKTPGKVMTWCSASSRQCISTQIHHCHGCCSRMHYLLCFMDFASDFHVFRSLQELFRGWCHMCQNHWIEQLGWHKCTWTSLGKMHYTWWILC